MKLKINIPEDYLKDTPTTYIVPKEVKRLWAVQLDLLAVIDEICRKYKIRYSIDSGSLIGACRHGGYIPWDDDIDVVMLRSDFEKFEKVVEQELHDGVFYQNWRNSPGYCRTFGRLLNTNTEAYIKNDLIGDSPLWDYRQCVFVDILVADNIPDDFNLRKIYFNRLIMLWRRYWLARRHIAYAKHWRIVPKSFKNCCFIFRGMLFRLLAFCGINLQEKWFAEFRKEQRRFENEETVYVAPFTNRPYEVIRRGEFDDLIDIKFEFLKVKAFRNYEEILSTQYGNWRKHVIGYREQMKYNFRGVFDD